jgi:g-D-glutamyl-meso-diaminopimelate peptidase
MKIKVRQGDTFWYYSYLFKVPLHLILNSNPKVRPNDLIVSQEVNIPGFRIIPYRLKLGDNLTKLSKARQLTVDALMLLNRHIDPNSLTPGDVIFLPKRIITPIVRGKEEYSFNVLLKDLHQLKKAYPFIRLRTIGKSVLGRPIHELRIGSGKKKVHMNASFHANEWITTAILMKLINEYLLSLTNGSPIYDQSSSSIFQTTELSIVPMVNPDGVELVLNGPSSDSRDEVISINGGSSDFTGWKANIRGIDLNNQFPAKWDIEKRRKEPKLPAPRDYPGDFPLSEPEAVAMAELTKNSQFDRVIAFHTQGEEFYWGYEGYEPSESEGIAKEFERVSGYHSVQYVDSHAGYKDWFIQEFRRPGFTVELGKGINPLPLSQYNEIYKEVVGLFFAALYL